MAAILFIVGIGLYELLGWKAKAHSTSDIGSDSSNSSDVQGDRIGYRNVFIIFMITVGLYIIYDLAIFVDRVLDEHNRESRFGTSRLGGFHAPAELRHLQENLSKIQHRLGLTPRLDELLARDDDLVSAAEDSQTDQMADPKPGTADERARIQTRIKETLRESDTMFAQSAQSRA